MDVRRAAEALECSPSMIYALISERRLKCYRVGRKGRRGKIVIEDEAVEAFKREMKAELSDD